MQSESCRAEPGAPGAIEGIGRWLRKVMIYRLVREYFDIAAITVCQSEIGDLMIDSMQVYGAPGPLQNSS